MPVEQEKKGISRRFFLRTAIISGAAALAFQGDTVIRAVEAGAYGLEYLAFLQEERKLPEFRSVDNYSILFGISAENRWYERIEEREALYGHKPQISNYFLYGYDNFSIEVTQEIVKTHTHGILPILSWGEANSNFGANYDENLPNIRKLARALQRFDFPVVFRPYYEINGDWTYDWYYIRSADHFVRGWQRMYEIFKEEKADNVLFCFSPNAWTGPEVTQFEKFFPGDDYIDFSSFDLYDHANLPPRIAIGHDIAVMQQLSRKKYGISECGSSRKRGQGQWMQDIMRYTASAGSSFFMPYDRDEREKEGIDWRVGTNPELRVVIPHELKSAYYSVNNPEPLTEPRIKAAMLQVV